MFTGIVSAIGTVQRVTPTARGLRLQIKAPYRGVAIGESVAVDGACLTVVAKGKGFFAALAIGTTRRRTKVAGYRAGTPVNLERALTLGDRLGGHLVAGHVDGVGRVVARCEDGDALLLDLEVPAEVAALCVPHGSIAVDGVSLTVNKTRKTRKTRTTRRTRKTRGAELVQVAIIAHTRTATTLGGARVGDRVHLEADLIGKFVQQLVQPYRAAPRRRES